MFTCSNCGAFFTIGAVDTLDRAGWSTCHQCGGEILATKTRPDPEDPYETPMTSRQAARYVNRVSVPDRH